MSPSLLPTAQRPSLVPRRPTRRPPGRPSRSPSLVVARPSIRPATPRVAASRSRKRRTGRLWWAVALTVPAFALWSVATTDRLGVVSDWMSFHFQHGIGNPGPAGTLDLGPVTTDVRDEEGGVYTLDVSVTLELKTEVSDEARRRIVAEGRHAVLQGIRHLGYEAFSAERFQEARTSLTERVVRQLGEGRVERVLFTDFSFYPDSEKPPIAPFRSIGIQPPAPQRPPLHSMSAFH